MPAKAIASPCGGGRMRSSPNATALPRLRYIFCPTESGKAPASAIAGMAATAITAPSGQVASGVGAVFWGNASTKATAPAAPSVTASSKLRLAKFAPVNNPAQPRDRARRTVVMALEERSGQRRSKGETLEVVRPVVAVVVALIPFIVHVPGLGSHCLHTRQGTANPGNTLRWGGGVPDYSYRSATMGSSAAARCAG